MSNVNIDSSAIHSHLSFIQGIINRMGTNSASCKTWCITLVSAIIIIAASEQDSDYIWIASFPLMLFMFLDAYYLGLERRFIDSYNNIVENLHSNTFKTEDVFRITFKKGIFNTVKATISALMSTSIYPFYLLLVAILVTINFYI